MSKFSKTPYELRLELLILAERTIRSNVVTGSYNGMVSAEEIIEYADKLNEFISKDGRSENK